MSEKQTQAFVPKARLIQILGEHLIKDATVGLLELVKNSYDADATKVQITISSINTPLASIEIKDNGHGMDAETFLTKWMNPASGHKQLQKVNGVRSQLGRLPLGEKGVGRFAAQQIGRKLLMYTKTKSMADELEVEVDWSEFDAPDKDLSDAKVTYSTRPLETFQHDGSGMILSIGGLRAMWSEGEVRSLSTSLRRMKSPFKGANDFDVSLKFDNCPAEFSAYEDLESSDILEKAPYKFYGLVDREGKLDFEYEFEMPGFESRRTTGQVDLTQQVGDISIASTVCGGFIIRMLAYDRSSKYLKTTGVSPHDLNAVCGMSVYRDGMRVLPYGEPGNDWLNLGYRRIQSPGSTLSNDQIIGLVEIDQVQNPKLIDKTNREGLIENEAYIGLRHLVLGVVEIFEGELIEDRQALRPKKEKTPELELEKSLDSIFATLNAAKDNVQKKGETASASVIDELMPILQKGIDELRQTFGDQSDYYQGERKTLLALAGTGLAAERFTHEFSRLVNGANTALERLERRIASDIERDPKTKRDVDTIRGALEALKNDIRLLGPMFYIKRVAREKELDVWQMVENTRALQEVALHRSGIVFEIVGGTFSITMREGSCMQVLNNLVDNAIFWVSRKSEADRRKIRVVIDPDEQSVYVSDSGPGVIARHREKIFEPFFSLKGEEGRGLGLYIAQEILEEKAWSIAVVDADAHPSLLNGANFKILFRGTNA